MILAFDWQNALCKDALDSWRWHTFKAALWNVNIIFEGCIVQYNWDFVENMRIFFFNNYNFAKLLVKILTEYFFAKGSVQRLYWVRERMRKNTKWFFITRGEKKTASKRLFEYHFIWTTFIMKTCSCRESGWLFNKHVNGEWCSSVYNFFISLSFQSLYYRDTFSLNSMLLTIFIPEYI